MVWVVRVVAAAAVVVVAWVCATAWPVIVHGHPAYAVLLVATLLVAAAALARSGRERRRSGWRAVGRVLLVVLAVGWIATMAWLRPFSAKEPAIAALESDERVTVTEYPTQIVLSPVGDAGPTAVFWGEKGIPSKTTGPLAIWREWCETVEGAPIASGHFLAEEAPRATAAALLSFLGP